MSLTVPAIPGVPRSLPNDAQTFLSAVKYTIDMREGRIGGEGKFVTGTEVQGFIRDIYSGAKGRTFIKKVANFLGDIGVDSDIHLSDITGDGIVTITADGQIVISAPGGLVIQDEGTLIVNVGEYDDPDGGGIIVGDVANGYGWAMNAAGLFSWWDEMPLHAFVTEDGSGTGISWQQSTDHGLEPITSPWKIYTGDAVIGGYNYKVTGPPVTQLGGLFWDQSAGTLYIRGDIKNATINTGGIMTVQNTGYLYIETTTANSGLLVGSLSAVTGWKINATGILGYNGTGLVHVLAIGNGITVGTGSIDAGDVVFGTYFGTSTGVWWDDNAGKLYIKGEIISGTVGTGSLVTITGDGYVHINTNNGAAGLIIGTWTVGNNALKFNTNGIFMNNATAGESHIFANADCTWQSKSLHAGDAIIGQYWTNGGIYWDQDDTRLKIRGRAIAMDMVAGGTFTISSTGYIFIDTSSSNSGLMVGTITPSGGTGWLINSSGLFGYSGSSGYFAAALSSVSWDSTTIDTGDVMIGKYNTGKGILWDNSAGRLYIRGGLNVTGAESIVMDTTGGFTLTAGTCDINTTSGMTIGSGSKLTINSTEGIKLSTQATINYDGNYVYISPDSATRFYIGSSGDAFTAIYLYGTTTTITGTSLDVAAGTGALAVRQTYTDITISGALAYSFYGSYFHPIGTTGTKNLGGTDNYWANAYADMYYQKTVGSGTSHTTDFDSYDDLKIIESYGGENMVVEPWRVLPVECTNIELLAKEESITVDEVYGRKDLEKRVFYNPLMVGIFSLGATKQLFNRVKELEAELANLKTKLN